MVGHKTSLSKFKRIKILQSIFSDNNGVKLGKKNRKQFRGCTDKWELSDTLLSNQWSKKSDIWKKRHNLAKLMGDSESGIRGKCNAYNRRDERSHINSLIFYPKTLLKKTKKNKASRKIK